MKKWVSIIILLVFSNAIVLVAKTYTIAGYVIEKKTGETLIGANVIIQDELKGAATDKNGYFQIIGINPGKYTLTVSHIGYAKREAVVSIHHQSITLEDIALEQSVVELENIEITASRSDVADIDIESSHRQIKPEVIRRIPTSRNDVFRAVKFLPGIQGIDPISPLYSVRGGDPGENLVLLDGVPIYNPYHCVISSGLFNLYAVKDVEMLLGGFGVEYGGCNSSVLYITTREGNNQKLHGEIEPTLTHTKFVFDFPVGRNATMMISGRAYYDLVSRFLFYSPNYFYDMNWSLNCKLDSKNRLSLRYFYSKDFMDIRLNNFFSYIEPTFHTDIFEDYHIAYHNKWHNQAATAVLKTVINPNIYLKTQIFGSFFSSNNLSMLDFEYLTEEDQERVKLAYSTELRNKIFEMGIKSKANFLLSTWNTLTLGGEYHRYSFSNDVRINDLSEGETTRDPYQTAGFIEEKVIFNHLILRLGLRASKFSLVEKWVYEPRIHGVLHLPWNMKLRGAWGHYYQYIVSINSQEYELSQFLDYYYPLKDKAPSASIHYILGLDKTITDHSRLSVDVYYKDIPRVYSFDYNVSELEAYHFSDKLKEGAGKSYGIEFLLMGRWKRLSGWVSFGVSKSTRSYPHIMNGSSFLYDYDRLYSFKTMINHQVHTALSYSVALQIMSGVPKTLETVGKSYFYYDPLTNEYASYPTYTSNRKNNVRFPMYMRLDVGLKKRIRKGFGADLAEFLGAKESYLNASFGNLLFLYRNVMFYFPINKNELYGLGLNYFPEFSMGYTIKF